MATPTQRRLPPAARREQLVDVALALFAESSYEAVGLEEVANAAGVRRSLLYRYFPDGKPDLYLAVVEEAWRRLVHRIDTDPSRPLERKLPENVATFLDLSASRDPALRVAGQARRVDEPRVRKVVRESRRAWATRIAANHGEDAPSEATISVLSGYLALSEVLMEEWLVHRTLSRDQLETVLEAALPAVVELALAE
ncbi:MAG: TetR/AcrR family transcriptional regulator [Solirubrobacteraceae bacterium]